MRQRLLKAVVGFAAAFAVLAAFTWMVGIGELTAAVSRASVPLLMAGLALAFLGVLTIGVTWWIVVKDLTGYTVEDGLRVFFATQFANAITPFGQLGGEPFIAYILSVDSGESIERSFGAVLAADILNTVQFFTFTIIGIVVFLYFYPLNSLVSLVLRVVLLLLLAFVVGFLLFWHRKASALRLLGGVGRLVGRLLSRLGMHDGRSWDAVLTRKGENFYEVIEELAGQKRKVAFALFLSHFMTGFWVAGFYTILLSMGFDAPLSAFLFVLPASMLAGYLPLPGGVGGIEVAMAVLVSSVAGVPLAVAEAAALLFRLPTYWAVIAIGGTFASHLSVEVLAPHR
ncbi:MAG: lysylphosphatidylglycerol synthase transmembrane domain-containing protein [Candidatus Nanohaloarchaea archaeon]|nr:lysylphosphatidylglycerol synthase transmembrane domain-containing protein [Candidatus Nanohaloarchaea archaeon]